MNTPKMVPMGAALLALGLGLVSAVPASARDNATKEPTIIRIAQVDRDEDRNSDSGYLGVQVQRLTPSLRRAKGIPESTEGTLVSSVEEGSPADDAGLKRGDVILEVNRQETPDPGELIRVVRGLEPGRRISVQIWRDGVTRTYNLKVGSRPSGSDVPAPPAPPRWEDRDGNAPEMPDRSRIQILRRSREDLERQIRELQAQVDRLEREIRDLQQQMNRRGRGDRYRDDRDRDNNEDD